MKHKYLFLSILMMGTGYGVAQQQHRQLPVIDDANRDFQLAQGDVASRYSSDNPIVNATSSGDTLWYSDFETVSDWSFQNQGGFGWQIVDAGQETGWFLNELMSTSGGNRAEMDNGDPNNNDNGPREQIMVTANPIDVSSVSGSAVLMFQQRTWRFLDQYHIEVSNNGTNWTEIGNNDHILTSTAFNSTVGSATNPEYVAYWIPASVAGTGNNSLWVRFRWNDLDDDGIAYGWVIDDVVVYRGAANDLEIQESMYLGVADSAAFYKYSQIPKRQGANSNFRPAAMISNRGDATQSNVVLNVTESTLGYSESAPATTLSNDQLEFVEVGNLLQPSTEGLYSVTYSVSNGQSEWISINNTDVWDFELTNTSWAYDDGDPQAASWYGDAGYTMCLYFDNFIEDTIRGIDVFFPQFSGNTGDFGLEYGEVIGAFIYNTSTDTVLGENAFFTVEDGAATGFVDDWVTIPLNVPIEGSRSGYYACFRAYNDEIPFGIEWDNPSGLSLVDPDNAGTWFNPITTTADTHNIVPMVRVKTSDPQACQGVNIVITGTVVDVLSQEPFTGSVDITVSGNGTAPLTFDWSGPGNFSVVGNEDIEDIDEKGTYTVTVTDVNGCFASESFDVQGNIGVEGLNAQSLNVYPNPANDQLTVAFGIAGNFNVELVNLKGELISARQVNTSVGNTVNFDVADLPAGVYVVKVYNDSEKVTKEIVIK